MERLATLINNLFLVGIHHLDLLLLPSAGLPSPYNQLGGNAPMKWLQISPQTIPAPLFSTT
jgi:hypothetical protein